MEKLNAIVLAGKVYEAKLSGSCEGCHFNKGNTDNCWLFQLCGNLGCIFRYSQSLTDKLNDK